jgi:hypothetical protein
MQQPKVSSVAHHEACNLAAQKREGIKRPEVSNTGSSAGSWQMFDGSHLNRLERPSAGPDYIRRTLECQSRADDRDTART